MKQDMEGGMEWVMEQGTERGTEQGAAKVKPCAMQGMEDTAGSALAWSTALPWEQPGHSPVCGIIKSQNYRLVWAGGDLKTHLVPPPAVGRDTFHCPRLLQAPSNLALGTSRDPGAATAALGTCARMPPSPAAHAVG